MIYIDQIRTYPISVISQDGKPTREKWCHMTGDDMQELHQFAEDIGCERSWFQDHPAIPNYKINPTLRSRALQAGAKVIDTREMLTMRIKGKSK